jgi:RNA polymerase sigma-70 factor (ECF subfamily)
MPGGKPTGTTDQILARRIQADPGSRDAADAASELFSRYYRRVYGLCYHYVREYEKARDLAQEVLARAYQKIGTFQWNTNFAAWIFTLTRHRCMSEMRRRTFSLDDSCDPDSIADESGDPEQAFFDKVDEEALIELIRNELSPEEQAAIWLRCFERMSILSVTQILGIEQVSGARAVLQRARKKLRAALSSGIDRDGV